MNELKSLFPHVIEKLLSDLIKEGKGRKLYETNPNKYNGLVKAYDFIKSSNATNKRN